jgi:hypothetical protein
LETVRDFGKYFFNPNGSGINKELDFTKIDPESLEKDAAQLLDNSNDAIQIRGLQRIEIKSIE